MYNTIISYHKILPSPKTPSGVYLGPGAMRRGGIFYLSGFVNLKSGHFITKHTLTATATAAEIAARASQSPIAYYVV